MSTMTTQRVEGICDICGALIVSEWRPGQDTAFTDEGRMFTWVRHYATAPPGADPKCAVYFSEVYEVPWPREASNQKPRPAERLD